MSHPMQTANVLDEVVGGNWSYKSERGVFECKAMPSEIAIRIDSWLAAKGIRTHEVRSGLAIPAGQSVISISADQPFDELARLSYNPETLYDAYARELGITQKDTGIGAA